MLPTHPDFILERCRQREIRFIGLPGTAITLSATNNSFAVAHEFSRPRLAVRLASRTSLRHSIPGRTLRVLIPPVLRLVGLPGIEPGLQDPQPCVLPLYDSPFRRCALSGRRKSVMAHTPFGVMGAPRVSSHDLCRAAGN